MTREMFQNDEESSMQEGNENLVETIDPFLSTPPVSRINKSSFAERLAARNMSSPPSQEDHNPSRKYFPPSCLTPQAYLPHLFSSASLESPLLLSTNQAEPSPTTGSFMLPHLLGGNALWMNPSPSFHERMMEQNLNMNGNASETMFKPITPTAIRRAAEVPETKPAVEVTSEEVKFQNFVSQESPRLMQFLPPSGVDGVIPAEYTPEKAADDGYNWRKYGQKVVKGAPHPRSYFKCTFGGCEAKKKVFRSDNGEKIETHFIGEHNHPKPAQAKRLSFFQAGTQPDLTLSLKTPGADGPSSVKEETEANMVRIAAIVRSECAEEESHRLSSEDSALECSAEAPKVEEEQDQIALKANGNQEEKKASSPVPRLVIQVQSDVEILDDGYRWRKYGQKFVKGNKHPRSYYKCTFQKCKVRKHVERSSSDSRLVVTTYEGKHDHDIPSSFKEEKPHVESESPSDVKAKKKKKAESLIESAEFNEELERS